jgi:hypothetical protein
MPVDFNSEMAPYVIQVFTHQFVDVGQVLHQTQAGVVLQDFSIAHPRQRQTHRTCPSIVRIVQKGLEVSYVATLLHLGQGGIVAFTGAL